MVIAQHFAMIGINYNQGLIISTCCFKKIKDATQVVINLAGKPQIQRTLFGYVVWRGL